MFGYNPFYDDYYYYRPIRVYNPFNSMSRYMTRLEDRMNSIFNDIFEEEFYNALEDKSKENDKGNKGNKENKENKESEISKEVKETQRNIVKSKEEEKEKEKPESNYYYKTFSTTRNYSHNGKDKFEEIREQTSDGNNTYISKIKRIGNRWVQVDEVVDKEGKKTTKETWHNISENEIESFEDEWNLRKGIESGIKPVAQIKSDETKESKETKETKEETKETKEEKKEN